MHNEADLIRKFKSIERLFSGTKTEGEKHAALNALDRIKQRLKEFQKTETPIEYKFTLSDRWSRRGNYSESKRKSVVCSEGNYANYYE